MNKRLSRFLRKAHRVLAIPMALFVMTKMLLTDTPYEAIALRITSATMIFMLISGLVMYFQTVKVKS